MRIRAGLLLLGALFLSSCDTPQNTADATKPVAAKRSIADRFNGTGSLIPQRSDDQQQQQAPDVQTTGGEDYANAVRNSHAGVGGSFSPH